jgi:hypothetical protein
MSLAVTGYDVARKLKAAADGLPKAAQQGVVKAAALMEVAVSVSSGKYAGKRIVKTKTLLLLPIGAEVKMVSRKAHLLDHDTKGHEIVPKNAAFLVFPDTANTSATHRRSSSGLAFAEAVKHPGTTGKFMWEKALLAATPKMEAIMNESIGNQFVKQFL